MEEGSVGYHPDAADAVSCAADGGACYKVGDDQQIEEVMMKRRGFLKSLLAIPAVVAGAKAVHLEPEAVKEPEIFEHVFRVEDILPKPWAYQPMDPIHCRYFVHLDEFPQFGSYSTGDIRDVCLREPTQMVMFDGRICYIRGFIIQDDGSVLLELEEAFVADINQYRS